MYQSSKSEIIISKVKRSCIFYYTILYYTISIISHDEQLTLYTAIRTSLWVSNITPCVTLTDTMPTSQMNPPIYLQNQLSVAEFGLRNKKKKKKNKTKKKTSITAAGSINVDNSAKITEFIEANK